MEKIDLNLDSMSPAQLDELLNKANEIKNDKRQAAQVAYESLRGEFCNTVKDKLFDVTKAVTEFRSWLNGESSAFREVMQEYCQLRQGQRSITVAYADFRIEIKESTMRTFDERADAAAERLVDYLRKWIVTSGRNTDDAMYQLVMTLLERNQKGDLDKDSIEKLYKQESKFDEGYKEIMNLFRESRVVEHTSLNYYFYRRDEMGVWRKIEPSFCRL